LEIFYKQINDDDDDDDDDNGSMGVPLPSSSHRMSGEHHNKLLSVVHRKPNLYILTQFVNKIGASKFKTLIAMTKSHCVTIC